MRRPATPLLAVLTGLIVVACSSNNSVVDATGQVATAITVVTGDGQSAAPGALLPVTLSVLVKDSAGNGVAGVTVHFTVDSGGGSIAASAITNSSGVASAGQWTLGAASGTNVVTAAVGSLVPVKFHAQTFAATARTLFSSAPVGPGGATLTYTKAGDPLNGLSITVPAGAFAVSTQWSVTADSSIAAPLPADFTQVGPALIISNGQGYADSAISLTMPMNVPFGDAVAPFYFDPATSTLEAIPLVARNATTATLAARHFSAELMAIPGTAPSGLRASLRTGFGSVRMVWVRLPAASLIGTYATGFQVQKDNWEFINYGDYIGPGGDCEGMSITEMYYYYFVTLGGRPSLYHHFDKSLANPHDNIQGIRFAGSVQADYVDYFHAGFDQMTRLNSQGAANGITTASLTASWIALSIKLNHQPVLIGLQGPGGGHAVVAYGVTVTSANTIVSFADPNFPTNLRGMLFEGGQLDPVQESVTADQAPDAFTTAYALGVSAEVPLRNVDARWVEFLNKQAGQDRIPSGYQFEVFDKVNQVWNAMGDTVRTTVDDIKFRVRCPACPQQVPGSDPPDMQVVRVYNDSGTDLALPAASDAHTYELFSIPEGTTSYVVVGSAHSPFSTPPGKAAFLDSRNITVINSPLLVAPSSLIGLIDTAYTLTATNGGAGNASTKFTWSFGDGTPAVSVVGDSAIKHTFADTGQFVVQVQMFGADSVLLGRATSDVTMRNYILYTWRLDQATLVSTDLPPAGIGIERTDTLVLGLFNGWMASLQQTPQESLLFALQFVNPSCGEVVLEQFTGPVTTFELSDANEFGFFADNCPDPDHIYTGTFALGAIGAGVLNGELHHGELPDNIEAVPGGSIQSTMAGLALSGTFVWRAQYSTGVGTYTVQFHAVRVNVTPGSGLRASARLTTSRKPVPRTPPTKQ